MATGHISKQQRREQARERAQRRQTRRVLVVVGGIVGVALVALIAISLSGNDDSDTTASDGQVSTAVEGWVLPAMGSTADTQETVALADFSGSPTITNFFASWCTACDAELPAFVSVTEQVGDRVDFVGVASQETGDPMFMPQRHGLDGLWPLARDAGPDGSGLTRGLGARGMPVTAFYDAQGALLEQHVGAMTETSLLETIADLYGIEPQAAATATETSVPTDEQRFPDVVEAELERADDGWRVSATLSSPYDTPDRYADAFRVRTPDGTVLGVRELLHDHADEQPFTRSLDDVDIPDDVDRVVVEGRDLDNGWGGDTVTVEVPR